MVYWLAVEKLLLKFTHVPQACGLVLQLPAAHLTTGTSDFNVNMNLSTPTTCHPVVFLVICS